MVFDPLRDIMITANSVLNGANIVVDKDDDDAIIRSLSIEGQVAVADLVVTIPQENGNPVSETVPARLDFSGVPDSQLLLWAAKTKMLDLKRALSGCSLQFCYDLVKQGPVCCTASEAENIFKDSAPHDSFDNKLDEIAAEYFCYVSIEGQVAVMVFDVTGRKEVDNGSVGMLLAMGGRRLKLLDKPLNFQMRVDFTGVHESQLLLWAAYTKMMELHVALSYCDNNMLKDLAKIGVCRHASSASTPFDESSKKQNRAMAVVQDMSAEERAELIRQLQEMDK